MRLVYIEWEDASSQNGWHTREEVQEYAQKSTMVHQVGWVFEETSRYILLVSRHAPGGIFSEDIDESFAHLQKIPQTWVRKRIDLTTYVL